MCVECLEHIPVSCACGRHIGSLTLVPLQDKDSLLSSAEQSLKLLLFRGWALNTVPPIDTRSIPRRVKNVCVLQKKSSDHAPYQPEVLDLSKLELSTELLVSLLR